MKTLWKAALAIVATPFLAAAFWALLAAALSVPDKAVARNISEDWELFGHSRLPSFTGRKIDVGTECIGVSYGLGDGEGANPFAAAARSPVIFDCPTLVGHVRRGEPANSGPYAQYWHGYAVISRPLLAIIPYHDVRMLTFNAMAALFASLAIGLWRVGGARLAIGALLPFYFINYSGFFELWTKAVGWMVMLVAANIIVRTDWTRSRTPYLLFYFMGAMTAYVDHLSTPLLIFGFPAALYFLLKRREAGDPLRADIVSLALIGAFWSLGYGGLWLAKIAIATHSLGPDFWASTLEIAAFRVNGAFESVKHFVGAATLENFEAFKAFWGGLAILTFFVAPLVRRHSRARLVAMLRASPALGLLAVSPIVWYELLSNHSQIHGLFTHANLALTFLPFSLVLTKAA
jgi:hypothetical protein